MLRREKTVPKRSLASSDDVVGAVVLAAGASGSAGFVDGGSQDLE
jgi:hypothetical protein